jgi:hypothetical protein
VCNDLQMVRQAMERVEAVRALTSREEKRCFLALYVGVTVCVSVQRRMCGARASVGLRWDDDDAKAAFCATRLAPCTSLQVLKQGHLGMALSTGTSRL